MWGKPLATFSKSLSCPDVARVSQALHCILVESSRPCTSGDNALFQRLLELKLARIACIYQECMMGFCNSVSAVREGLWFHLIAQDKCSSIQYRFNTHNSSP
jgi:hypothetical protein